MDVQLEPHQELAKDFLVANPFAALFLQMSFGKTLVTLKALEEIKPSGHILVVAPLAIAKNTWPSEVAKWDLGVRTQSLVLDEKGRKLTAAKRKEIYASIPTAEPTMYFINVELFCDLVDNMPTARAPGQRKQVVQWPFPTVIIDESQSLKNRATKRFKAMKQVRPAITRMIQLTGTPMPNSYTELWSQMYLLDGGRALGPTFAQFADHFFDEIPSRVPNVPPKLKPKPWAPQDIHRRIAHLAANVEMPPKALPGLDVHTHRLDIGDVAMSDYQQFADSAVLEVVSQIALGEDFPADAEDLETTRADPADADADTTPAPSAPVALKQTSLEDFMISSDQMEAVMIEAVNSAVLKNKLLQLASGTLYLPQEVDDEGRPTTGPRKYITIHQAKTEKLMEIIDAADSPVMVAYNFVATATETLTQLKAAGYDVERFDGSPEMVDRWNSRQIPVMLIQPRSAGHGLNLQYGGHIIVWLTLPWSTEPFDQTNARLNRTGQHQVVDVHILLADGTHDTEMPKVLATKSRDQDATREALRRRVENAVGALSAQGMQQTLERARQRSQEIATTRSTPQRRSR